MNCYFCNNKIYLYQFNRQDVYYTCNYCNTEYYDNGHANIYLNGKKDLNNLYFQFFLIPFAAKSRIIDKHGNIVLEVNYMLDINPNNIKDKLKTYILFS